MKEVWSENKPSTWLYWLVTVLYTLHPQKYNEFFKIGTIYTGIAVYRHLTLTPVLGFSVSIMALLPALALAPHLHIFGPALPSLHNLPKQERVKGLGLLNTNPADTWCILGAHKSLWPVLHWLLGKN